MHRTTRWWAPLLAACVVFGAAGAGAQPGAVQPPLTPAELARMAQGWAASVRQHDLSFDAAGLDEPVRRHGERLADELQVTFERLGRAWLVPEGGGATTSEGAARQRLWLGQMALLARLHLAWQEPGHAEASMALLQQPRLCDIAGRRPTLAWRLNWLQQLPPAAREAGFEADRTALRALADPQWQPPPRPRPTLLEDLEPWIAERMAGRDDGLGLGMVPRTAVVLFNERRHWSHRHWSDRCRVAAWWARERVHRGRADPATALQAFRHATAPRPADYVDPPDDDAEATAFPAVARQWQVEATVVASWRRDALGRPTDVRVDRRRLTVPDGPPGWALAWEIEFDRAALATVAAQPAVPVAAGADPQQRFSAELVFRLE